jgi:ABC-type polysaccharide transport system permease subunit
MFNFFKLTSHAVQAVTIMQGRTALQRIPQITLPIIDPQRCILFIRQIQTLCELTFSGMKVRKSFSLQNTDNYV